jgi:H/ACA ribonucleoprotein complex subunit 4
MEKIEKIKQNKTTEELLEFGILNINKPSGPTSFDVSDFVRKKLGIRKTSHFGTLDPKVTGVLPIALNRACKLTGFFLGEDKEYIGIMRVHEDVDLDEIKKAIEEKFTGKILQTPPKRSRVKRQERERDVKNFELLERNGREILFRAEVQGGTYIRKLISDLGDYMKIGAHMLELRRIRAGIFTEDDKIYPAINLYDFEKAVDGYKNGDDKELRKIIIPAEIVMKVYPCIEIKKDNLKKIFTGKPISSEDLKGDERFEKDEIVCVFCGDEFIGMYKVINEGEIFAKADFVLQPIKNG